MAAKEGSEKKRGAEGRPRAREQNEGARVNKAEFVRNLPAGTSYADAEQLAKQKGIEITRGYFYVLRSEQNKSKKGGKAPREPRQPSEGGAPRAAKPRAAKGLRLTSDDPHEAALLEAVRSLGVARARQLIDAVEKLEG